MMKVQELNYGILSLALMATGCNQLGKQSSSSSSAGASNLGTSTYSNSLIHSNDTSAIDAAVAAQVQNSQAIISNIQNTSRRPLSPSRVDEFYKCGVNLSNTFVTPDSSPGADNSPATLATKLANSFTLLTKDALSSKIGAYDNYSVATDASGVMYVFYTSNTNKDVYYLWQDPTSGNWVSPRSLTNLKGFMGLPTASFDLSQQKIVVQIFDLHNKLYTYTQSDKNTFQASATTTASTQTDFDQLQATNGTNMETNYNTVLNSLSSPSEGTSTMTRVFNDIMTLGTAEIATAAYTEQQSQASSILSKFQKNICPASPQ